MNDLLYIVVYILVLILCIGGTYLFRKYNITKRDIEVFRAVISIGDYITKRFNFRYSEGVNKITSHVLTAISYINDYNNITDLEQKKILVKEKALLICKENNIKIDNNIIKVIDEIINYIVINDLIEI